MQPGQAGIDEIVASATGEGYEFFRRGDVLLRRCPGDEPERLIRGKWIRVGAPQPFGDGVDGWEQLSGPKLGRHVRKYLIASLDEAAVASEIGSSDWRSRNVVWRFFEPALKGGAEKRLRRNTAERSRTAYAEMMRDAPSAVLPELRDQALLGYEHQRGRIASAEQRATFFLGAAGLTTSLVLANAGLLLGTNKLDSPWRHFAAISLLVASVCAIAAGLRALQATMVTFIRTPPNGVPRIVDRRRATEDRLLRAYIAALLVGQHRLSVIADWKIARMKGATRWFVGAIVSVVVLTVFVLADVAATEPDDPDPSAGATSVAEVAVLGEDHRHPGRVAGLDDLGVAFGAARLDHRVGAGLDCQLGAVGKGEEGVGCEGGTG